MTQQSGCSETWLDVESVYAQIRTDIRTTDEISFKLLGLVPLVSGAGLLSLLFGDKPSSFGADLVVVLSLFAASVTLALFRWEMRNAQTCRWHIERARRLERHAMGAFRRGNTFFDVPKEPGNIGKGRAGKFLYGVTILAWLSLPLAVDIPGSVSMSWVHLGVVALIALGTMWSIAVDTAISQAKDGPRDVAAALVELNQRMVAATQPWSSSVGSRRSRNSGRRAAASRLTHQKESDS